MRFIFSSDREIVSTPDRSGLAYEDVIFPSSDGVQLHGWLIPGEAQRPLVLFFHGNAANISYRVENIVYLHQLGFPVFIFDYRGFGSSQGQATGEKDLYQDARGALGWLGERGWSPGRMIFFGRSMGAAVALQLAIETAPAGLVLESPFTSLRDIARKTAPATYALVGWWNIGDVFDNLDKIGRLKTPLLIFYGDRDPIVPNDMSLRLFARAGEPKSLYRVKGAGHSDAFEVGGEGYRQAWDTFVARVFHSEAHRDSIHTSGKTDLVQKNRPKANTTELIPRLSLFSPPLEI